jgi:hypothetical protein
MQAALAHTPDAGLLCSDSTVVHHPKAKSYVSLIDSSRAWPQFEMPGSEHLHSGGVLGSSILLQASWNRLFCSAEVASAVVGSSTLPGLCRQSNSAEQRSRGDGQARAWQQGNRKPTD